MEGVELALVVDLREQLAAVGRAEERIAAGTYGRSIESDAPIPDERLAAAPLAERDHRGAAPFRGGNLAGRQLALSAVLRR